MRPSNAPNRCRFCNEAVLWLASTSTGKVAPIDADPVPGGNIAVDLAAGVYVVLSDFERARFDHTAHDPDARPSLHMNHFATCSSPTAKRLARERQRSKVGTR